MAISGVNPKCFILALFVRDDGTRFLLGDDPFEFKDNQLHFQQNTMANDVVEVQGNDGYLLAGQVRRPGTQMFDGYVCNGTNSKEDVEIKRRSFLQFFRRSHFYKVIYVFPNGTAIQRKQGFLVDDPTVQELYQQYPEYHVALNFEDVNYYTYEEDDQGHEIYAKEAIVALARGGATGGLIWDSYGVVWEDAWSLPLSISGVQFQILNNAGARAPIDNVELYGDTYQQTYSGKNKAKTTDCNLSGTNYSFTIGSGNVAMVTTASLNSFDVCGGLRTGAFLPSYSTANDYNLTSNGGEYILSVHDFANSSTSEASGSISLAVFTNKKSGGRTITKTTTSVQSLSFSLDDDEHIKSIYLWVGTSTNANISMKLQLEAGSTATTYETYTGGIPAPNPDYPQDINVVAGEQTVEVRGKNLIDPTNLSFVYSNSPTQIELSSISDGIRMVNNGGVSQDRFAVFRSVDMTPYIGKVVRMKATFGTGGGIRLYRIASDGSNRSQMATTTVSDTEISFTVPDNLGASPYLGYVLDVTVGGGTTVDFTNLIATVDSSIEPYEPYQSQSYTVDLGSTELCKIGDYQDYIYKSGDDWYVHKECGKVVFDGTEAWNGGTSTGSPTYLYAYTVALDSLNLYSARQAFCSHFSIWPNQLATGTSVSYPCLSVVTPAAATYAHIRLMIPLAIAANTNGLRTWLGSHNTNLYYVLATSTDTKITDATLVGQLEALGAMKLFIGENNGLVSATEPNLPATLAFDYYTKFTTIGAEWEEGGTKGATIVNVDAIDNTYPVWELTGPAINPTLSVLTTNTALTYNGTITASQKLVIDMFNKTATLNGTSVIGNISGDFVYMAPGTNRVAYTAGNTDAPDSTIYWQEVVG